MSQRTTAETRLNERSSRSHGIFTIRVEHTVTD
jgi:Kinesin motor domain